MERPDGGSSAGVVGTHALNDILRRRTRNPLTLPIVIRRGNPNDLAHIPKPDNGHLALGLAKAAFQRETCAFDEHRHCPLQNLKIRRLPRRMVSAKTWNEILGQETKPLLPSALVVIHHSTVVDEDGLDSAQVGRDVSLPQTRSTPV